MLWHLPPSRSTLPTTTLPTYPLPAASSSLTTIHNNNSSSILSLGLILTQSLFCVIWIGKWQWGGYDYQRPQLQKFTFGGTHCGSTTSRNRFLSADSLKGSVSVAPRHHRQSRSEGIKSQPTLTLITTATMAIASYQRQQSRSIGGTTATSSFLFPLNVDFHTSQQQQFLHLHRYLSQFHSLIILV